MTYHPQKPSLQDISASFAEVVLRASLRITAWEACLINKEKTLSQAIAEEHPQIMMAHHYKPAINYLLKLDSASKSRQVNTNEISSFLLQLFDTLQETLLRPQSSSTADLRDYLSYFTRDMYRWQNIDPQVFVAALSLIDVFLDLFQGRSILEHEGASQQPLVDNLGFWKDFFERITYGFNLWTIRTRVRDILCAFLYPHEINELRDQLENEKVHKVHDARKLIYHLKTIRFNGHVRFEQYERSLSGAFWSHIPREEIVNTIFLKVTCEEENESDCYILENLLEQIGEVQHRWLRKSFYHPQPNGAQRFQIAIRTRLPEITGTPLFVIRIGTPNRYHYNQWGRLLDWVGLSPLKQRLPQFENIKTDIQASRIMSVYTQTGDVIELPIGSIVADFLNKAFPHTYRYLYRLTVNRAISKLDQVLKEGDVVYAYIDRHEQPMLPIHYLTEKSSHPVVQQILEENRGAWRTATDIGRERIMRRVREYIKHWNFTITEAEVFTLLKMQGYARANEHLDEVYARLAHVDQQDIRRDDALCELALQYRLRGQIETQDRSLFPVPWKNIHIARCCKTKTGR